MAENAKGVDETDFINNGDVEELDPRVQAELERLNKCTDEINRLELQLEEANSVFGTLLTDTTQQLKATATRLGGCIEKARPYFEALEVSNRAQKECQSAATHYQRASGVHAAAKETIALAEQRFLSNSSDWSFDNAWQEMLNHATIKVMEAEKAKTESEAEHQRRALLFTKAEEEVQKQEKKLRRNIAKSKPYFDQKDAVGKALKAQKLNIQHLQEKVKVVKADYARSLRSLEDISESIHARRRFRNQIMEQRQPGVGSEWNNPEHGVDVDGHVSAASSSIEDEFHGAGRIRSEITGTSNSVNSSTVENVSETLETCHL